MDPQTNDPETALEGAIDESKTILIGHLRAFAIRLDRLEKLLDRRKTDAKHARRRRKQPPRPENSA